jgi:hypothetical protein
MRLVRSFVTELHVTDSKKTVCIVTTAHNIRYNCPLLSNFGSNTILNSLVDFSQFSQFYLGLHLN